MGEGAIGVAWQLLKALYETRKVSKLFQELVISAPTQQGMTKLQVTTMAAPKPELQFICMVPLPGF